MQIHRIHGRDLREALERAGRLHGRDAVVLGHEQINGGVTVAITAAQAAGARAKAERPKKARPKPRAAAASPSAVRAPGLADVERALSRTGCSPRLIAEVLDAIERGDARGPYALDHAARLLGERLEVAPSPKVSRSGGGPCVIALVGPRGSGVTTTVTKLAGKLVKARRRVALVDLMSKGSVGQAFRPGLGQLEKYARLLQVPVDGVRKAAELREVLDRSRSRDVVLLDGSGVAGRDMAVLRELRALDPEVRLEVYLTLPANAYRGELDAIAADYGPLAPAGIVLTQLDATRTPAPALEHALDTGRPLAFLCDGADASGHLARPTADAVANLFLRGRLR